MNKLTEFTLFGFSSLRLRFWREFHRAGFAVFSPAPCLFAAILADGLKPFGVDGYLSSVQFLVTILTKGFSVGYIEAQFGIVSPLFYMVGMYLACCAAILTGVIISFVNGGDPLFIFVSTPIVCPFDMGGGVSTFLRAVFLRVPPSCKSFAAPLAGKDFCRVKHEITGIRTKSLVLSKILFFANGTGFVNSFVWHTSILPHLERMATAFPALHIRKL